MPRGQSPASKDNLTASRKRSNANLLRGGIEAHDTPAAQAAYAAEAEAVGELALQSPLAALEAFIRSSASHLAGLLDSERRRRAKPEQAVTARLEVLRKTIADAQAYRDRLTAELPFEQVALALEKRLMGANFSELSPPEPKAESEGDEGDEERDAPLSA